MLRRGFTLIEVVVVIGIMAVISSLMLSGFPKFNQRIILNREAGNLLLSLRKAQSYAMSVREFNATYTDDPFCANPPVKFPAYGVFLSTASPSNYIIFGDASCSTKYEDFPVAEAVETVVLERGVKLKSILGYDSGICSLGCPLNETNILFRRPGPATIIPYNVIDLVLSSPAGDFEKKVIIRSTGQISLK